VKDQVNHPPESNGRIRRAAAVALAIAALWTNP